MLAGMMKGSAVSRPENVSSAWAVGQDAAFEAQLSNRNDGFEDRVSWCQRGRNIQPCEGRVHGLVVH